MDIDVPVSGIPGEYGPAERVYYPCQQSWPGAGNAPMEDVGRRVRIEDQQRSQERLGEVLKRMGYVGENQLAQALSAQ